MSLLVSPQGTVTLEGKVRETIHLSLSLSLSLSLPLLPSLSLSLPPSLPPSLSLSLTLPEVSKVGRVGYHMKQLTK